MSDVRDTTDDLEVRLTRALHHEADAHDLPTPTAGSIGGAARRHDRRRRLELGTAVLVAAAIVAVLIVGPWRGTEDAVVDSGPEDPAQPLHLVLDAGAGYQLTEAIDGHAGADGQPPGTMPPEGRSDIETVFFGGSDPLTPPWLLVNIRTTENPTTWNAPTANAQATTIGGRPAVQRTEMSGVGEPQRASIGIKWDELHEVYAQFWGLDLDAAIGVIGDLRQDGSGRWTLDGSTVGLHEIARIADIDGDPNQDTTSYADPDGDIIPWSTRLTITPVPGAVSEPELVARALGSIWTPGTTVERTTVRGQPAIVVMPGPSDDASPPSGQRSRVLWFEPDHDVVVDLNFHDADRGLIDRAIANLREVGPEEWRSTLARCTAVVAGGTIAPAMPGTEGGPCPGAERPIGG